MSRNTTKVWTVHWEECATAGFSMSPWSIRQHKCATKREALAQAATVRGVSTGPRRYRTTIRPGYPVIISPDGRVFDRLGRERP